MPGMRSPFIFGRQRGKRRRKQRGVSTRSPFSRRKSENDVEVNVNYQILHDCLRSEGSNSSSDSHHEEGAVSDSNSSIGSCTEKTALLTSSERSMDMKRVASCNDTPWVMKSTPTTEAFVLLLHPKARIFEVILLSFSSRRSTVGGLLDMIPSNATEPVLGLQHYVGFYKLRDGMELLDEHATTDTLKIESGDLLVAIPSGYDNKKVNKLSAQILQDQRVRDLLHNADPASQTQIKKPATPRSNSKKIVRGRHGGGKSHEVKLELKLEKNQVVCSDLLSTDGTLATYCESTTSVASCEYNSCDDVSVAASYSSWTKSFDSAFAHHHHHAELNLCKSKNATSVSSSCTIVVPHKHQGHKNRRQKHTRLILKGAKMSFVMLSYAFLQYMANSDGYRSRYTRDPNQHLGLVGAVQCFGLFAILRCMQMHAAKRGMKN